MGYSKKVKEEFLDYLLKAIEMPVGNRLTFSFDSKSKRDRSAWNFYNAKRYLLHQGFTKGAEDLHISKEQSTVDFRVSITKLAKPIGGFNLAKGGKKLPIPGLVRSGTIEDMVKSGLRMQDIKDRLSNMAPDEIVFTQKCIFERDMA